MVLAVVGNFPAKLKGCEISEMFAITTEERERRRKQAKRFSISYEEPEDLSEYVEEKSEFTSSSSTDSSEEGECECEISNTNNEVPLEINISVYKLHFFSILKFFSFFYFYLGQKKNCLLDFDGIEEKILSHSRNSLPKEIITDKEKLIAKLSDAERTLVEKFKEIDEPHLKIYWLNLHTCWSPSFI